MSLSNIPDTGSASVCCRKYWATYTCIVREMPFSIGKTPEQHIKVLKNNLELSSAYAECYSDIEQKRMMDYYNIQRNTMRQKVISLATDPEGVID